MERGLPSARAERIRAVVPLPLYRWYGVEAPTLTVPRLSALAEVPADDVAVGTRRTGASSGSSERLACNDCLASRWRNNCSWWRSCALASCRGGWNEP
jgi:hypothetical protein